jgi:hypothetical protein
MFIRVLSPTKMLTALVRQVELQVAAVSEKELLEYPGHDGLTEPGKCRIDHDRRSSGNIPLGLS